MRKGKKGFVYVIDRGDGTIKIGMSVLPENRIKSVESELKFISVNSYITSEMENYTKVERAAHRELDSQRIGGEWFCCDFELGKRAVNDAILLFAFDSVAYVEAASFSGWIRLLEYIDMYHGGYVTKFATSIGRKPNTVSNWLDSGRYFIRNNEIIKWAYDLPQTEIDHVKKVRGI